METSEIYNLKWDEHYSKVVLESFWNLLGQEVLTDCTLVCSTPAESVQVHRLILSANSPYFRTLLKTHSAHPHPIIILHDVDLAVLKMLVTFMYRGEVNVSSSTFPLLLKTAENLQIIGLSQSQQPSNNRFSNAVSNSPVQTTHYSKKARILENSTFDGGLRKVSNSGGSGGGGLIWVGLGVGGLGRTQIRGGMWCRSSRCPCAVRRPPCSRPSR
ncbi:longitudinals lacking protein-like [Folsomia candida]|uniref:longitudinals lacking protein-like n=1 Tax=Folsomia candida TaxID=158441 RepID=UPI001605256C|nr:longitudinals lacking protein-like [Folsomia candida]